MPDSLVHYCLAFINDDAYNLKLKTQNLQLITLQNIYENKEWSQCLYSNWQDHIFRSGCAGYHYPDQSP